MLKEMTKVTEEITEQETICRGCGCEKAIGEAVCNNCYEYRKGTTPYKYFEGDSSEWLNSYEMIKFV